MCFLYIRSPVLSPMCTRPLIIEQYITCCYGLSFLLEYARVVIYVG